MAIDPVQVHQAGRRIKKTGRFIVTPNRAVLLLCHHKDADEDSLVIAEIFDHTICEKLIAMRGKILNSRYCSGDELLRTGVQLPAVFWFFISHDHHAGGSYV
jgi:hypothetical protein